MNVVCMGECDVYILYKIVRLYMFTVCALVKLTNAFGVIECCLLCLSVCAITTGYVTFTYTRTVL